MISSTCASGGELLEDVRGEGIAGDVFGQTADNLPRFCMTTIRGIQHPRCLSCSERLQGNLVAMTRLASQVDLRAAMGRRRCELSSNKFDYDQWVQRTVELMTMVKDDFARNYHD